MAQNSMGEFVNISQIENLPYDEAYSIRYHEQQLLTRKYASVAYTRNRPTEGEIKCLRAFVRMGIFSIGTYILEDRTENPSSNYREFDFLGIFNNENNILNINPLVRNIEFLLEFDGYYHFVYSGERHRTMENYERYRSADALKVMLCIIYGIKIIRMHYGDVDNAEYHIKRALQLNKLCYFSSPGEYGWITQRLRSEYYNSE